MFAAYGTGFRWDSASSAEWGFQVYSSLVWLTTSLGLMFTCWAVGMLIVWFGAVRFSTAGTILSMSFHKSSSIFCCFRAKRYNIFVSSEAPDLWNQVFASSAISLMLRLKPFGIETFLCTAFVCLAAVLTKSFFISAISSWYFTSNRSRSASCTLTNFCQCY